MVRSPLHLELPKTMQRMMGKRFMLALALKGNPVPKSQRGCLLSLFALHSSVQVSPGVN